MIKMEEKIYIVKKEFYEEEYVLGVYNDKGKAEKIAQQFRTLEEYISKDSRYKINVYEYKLNALQEGVAEDILNNLEIIKEGFGIPKEEQDDKN